LPRFARTASAAVLTSAFAAVVIWGAVHHEPWRDEVVPLSIARQAQSLGELAEPLTHEGHPILWYLLLWLAYHAVGATWVLKAASLACAIGGVFLLHRSPLPLWLTAIVSFSFFPLYQYSVVSRGYSLEMLLLFACCALYPRRGEHPLALALLLAALANTEAFGLIMAVAIAVMTFADGVLRRTPLRTVAADRWVVAALVVYLTGLGLAAAVALPESSHALGGFQGLDLGQIAAGVGRAIAHPLEHSSGFVNLPAPSLWVWAGFLYLAHNPPVLGFAATSLVGIEVLFNVVYGPRAPWHIGNAMLVLVASAWFDAAATTATWNLPSALERARPWLARALAIALAVLFAGQVPRALAYLEADLANDHSSNRLLGELLRDDPRLAGAVLLGEPDTPLWSVRYYADNRVYLAREKQFRDWGVFVPSRLRRYDLGALLAEARTLRAECGCAVVITLGWDIDRFGTNVNFRGTQFEESFEVDAATRAEFLAATQPLARLRGPTITDESYDVFLLR